MSRTLYVVKWADCDDPWTIDCFLSKAHALAYAWETWSHFGHMWVRVVERRGKTSRVIWEDGDAK